MPEKSEDYIQEEVNNTTEEYIPKRKFSPVFTHPIPSALDELRSGVVKPASPITAIAATQIPVVITAADAAEAENAAKIAAEKAAHAAAVAEEEARIAAEIAAREANFGYHEPTDEEMGYSSSSTENYETLPIAQDFENLTIYNNDNTYTENNNVEGDLLDFNAQTTDMFTDSQQNFNQVDVNNVGFDNSGFESQFNNNFEGQNFDAVDMNANSMIDNSGFVAPQQGNDDFFSNEAQSTDMFADSQQSFNQVDANNVGFDNNGFDSQFNNNFEDQNFDAVDMNANPMSDNSAFSAPAQGNDDFFNQPQQDSNDFFTSEQPANDNFFNNEAQNADMFADSQQNFNQVDANNVGFDNNGFDGQFNDNFEGQNFDAVDMNANAMPDNNGFTAPVQGNDDFFAPQQPSEDAFFNDGSQNNESIAPEMYADNLQNMFANDDSLSSLNDFDDAQEYVPHQNSNDSNFSSFDNNFNDASQGEQSFGSDDMASDPFSNDGWMSQDSTQDSDDVPQAQDFGTKKPSGKKFNLPLLIILIVLVLAIVGGIIYILVNGLPTSSPVSSQPVSAPSQSSSATVSQPEVVEPVVDPIPRDEWYMELVNRDNILDSTFAPETTNVDGVPVDTRIAQALTDMIEAGNATGLDLYVHSGYRTYERQETNYDYQVGLQLAQGLTQAEAEAAAGQITAPPGTSEHNLGLGVDIMSTDNNSYDVSFNDTEEAKWLLENAANYGFILRYPEGKESITGFAFEPWHYRYVGVDQAQKIKDSGLTLEEYLAQDIPTGTPSQAQTADESAVSTVSSSQPVA